MLSPADGDKTGVALAAAEGLAVGGVIGVRLVLFVAVSGVDTAGTSLKEEDVRPAVPLKGSEPRDGV